MTAEFLALPIALVLLVPLYFITKALGDSLADEFEELESLEDENDEG